MTKTSIFIVLQMDPFVPSEILNKGIYFTNAQAESSLQELKANSEIGKEFCIIEAYTIEVANRKMLELLRDENQ